MTTQTASLVRWIRLITLFVVLTISIGCGDRSGSVSQPVLPTAPSTPPQQPTRTPPSDTTTPTSTPTPTPTPSATVENGHRDTRPTPLPSGAEDSLHPRLFFDAGDIATLQTRAHTTHADIWKPIEAFVENEEYLDVRLEQNNESFDDFRNAGNQLIAMAFVCVISEDAIPCDLAKETMLVYASWEHWDEGETRDLGLAHMLMGNAIAYDWLYATLSQEERNIIRKSLAQHATTLYEASIHTTYKEEWLNWWTSAFVQNHNWTNHSSLGLVGLALLDEHEDAHIWVEYAQERIERVQYLLNTIGDGTWHEGISYQRYGLTSLLAFLINLRAIEGVDLFPHTYIRNYSSWMVYNYLPGTLGYIMAYGDFEWEWVNAALSVRILRFIAAEYQDGYAEWLAQELLRADSGERDSSLWQAPWFVYEFLSYDPTVEPIPPDDLALAQVFDDLSGVIWRTGWSEQDLVFALKTGVYAGHFSITSFSTQVYPWERPCAGTACVLNIGHDHLDTNTFYLYANGSWLAPEAVGVDQSATSYHNTLLIDDQGQFAPPEEHDDEVPEDFIDNEGYIELTTSTNGFDYIAADATKRYKHISDINDVTRYVLFVRPDYFLMIDSIAADMPHQYDWVSHASENISVEDRWIRANAGNGNVLGIQVLAPESFDTTIGKDDLPYVHIYPSENVDDVRFVHVLYPTTEDQWENLPTSQIVEDNGVALAIAVTRGTHEESEQSIMHDDIIMTYATPPDGTTSVGAYEYNGAMAVVSQYADASPARIFMTGGTILFDQQRSVTIVQLDNVAAFEAVYQGTRLTVYSDISTGIEVYAPGIDYLEVNGEERDFVRNGDFVSF